MDRDIGNIVTVLQKPLSEDEEFKELSEKLEKFEDRTEADREELVKNINSYMNMMKAKYEILEAGVNSLTFVAQGISTTEERSANELFNKLNNHTLNEVKDRVLRLEMLTSDYIKGFIEPEALLKAEKIATQFVLMDEKFESLLFLIKNYKLLPDNLLKTSIHNFRDSLNKTNFKYYHVFF